jgi:hypothetical protein
MRLAMVGTVRTGAHWDKREIRDPHHSVRRRRRRRQQLAAVSGGLCDRRLISPAWLKRGSWLVKKLTTPIETDSGAARLRVSLIAMKAEANDWQLTGDGVRLARVQLRHSVRGETVSSLAG